MSANTEELSWLSSRIEWSKSGLQAASVLFSMASTASERIFGAIGATASIYLTAMLLERYQIEGLSRFSPAFFVYVPFAFLCVVVGCYLIHLTETNGKNKMKARLDQQPLKSISDSDYKDDTTTISDLLYQMLGNIDVVVIMTTGFIAGLAFNLFIFFTIFLTNEQLDISMQQIGFIFSGLNVSNILMFPFTGKYDFFHK